MTTNTVTQTIATGGTFRIVYRDGAGELTERCIRVERIFTHEATGHRLIVAWCYRRQAYRTFNAAQIVWAMPDDSTALSTFGMADAVRRQDIGAFRAAIATMRAA
jgi:predicted DNA-binding transcriptional regulator YafY